MAMKKFMIVVMAVLMAFTFSSCTDPIPMEYTVSFVGVERPSEKVLEGSEYKVPDIPKDGYVIDSIRNGDVVLKAGDSIIINGDVELIYEYKELYTVSFKGIIKELIGIAADSCYEIL